MTAVVSTLTAVVLTRLMPAALSLPSEKHKLESALDQNREALVAAKVRNNAFSQCRSDSRCRHEQKLLISPRENSWHSSAMVR